MAPAQLPTTVQPGDILAFWRETEPDLRNFFYLPLMHSEDLADQDRAVELARGLGGEALRYASLHRDAIKRFGRLAHRNEMLARTTTPEERKFLADGGFAG